MKKGAIESRLWHETEIIGFNDASSISDVPEEILLEIFTYISNAHVLAFSILSLVNRQWHRLVLDHSMLRKVHQSFFPHQLLPLDTLERGSLYFLRDLIHRVHQVMKECLTLPFRQDFELLDNTISAVFFKKLRRFGEYYNLNILHAKITSKLDKDNSIQFKQTNPIKHALQEIPIHHRIEKIDLNQAQLSFIPSEIKFFRNVTELVLSNNMLIRLPSEIRSLTALNYLNVSKNQLSELPAEIGHLSSLTALKLNGNQLTSLPEELKFLNLLHYLNLKGNRFTTFPLEICELKKLNMLKLNNNQLTLLPSEIGQLQELEFLIIAKNQLTKLPSEISNLPKIFRISFKLNKITSIPYAIKTLRSLGPGTLGALNQLSSENEA